MTEKDPTGRDAHAPGAKLDAGKNRPGLVLSDFAQALWAVSEVGTYGAQKYTEHGWLEVPNAIERYKDAALRHLLKESNELRDEDTGLLHWAHFAWNVLAVLELRIEHQRRAEVCPEGCEEMRPEEMRIEQQRRVDAQLRVPEDFRQDGVLITQGQIPAKEVLRKRRISDGTE